jgi:hypothetical protein
MTTGLGFSPFSHPEPGPELASGSKDFGISVLGFKAPFFRAGIYGVYSLNRVIIS